MQILMFGWEFPPVNSGGLGVACQGIVEGLAHHGHEIFLVLPKVSADMHLEKPDKLSLLAAHESGGCIKSIPVPSSIYSPYCNPKSYTKWIGENAENEPNIIYGKNLLEEIHRYAAKSAIYASKIPHDIIHTHDWLTAEAGIQAKKISDKPMVMHVHATEFDRSGENINQQVYDVERRGIHHADRVIAVSEYTKKMLIKHYGAPEWKIDVVHNAVKPNFNVYHQKHHLNETDKIVLFLGRMTMQKGPNYFLKMAKRVLEVVKRVKFVMAGDGDMMEQVIHMANDLGIERNVLFSGFLKGEDIQKAYAYADLYVMPSVSEPFGITPLEAIQNGTPVLISKQTGVSEVIKNALQVDFWDIDEMANKVIALLKYNALSDTLCKHSKQELHQISWQKQAKHIENVYKRVLNV